MRALLFLLAALIMLSPAAAADPPELASWLINTDGRTGYAGILADVQHVYYSASFVYVECTGIPAYDIGPWPGNPNTPAGQGWRFKIARAPQAAPNPPATPLGQIGVWTNGVTMFKALDARSYLNRGVWHQNAVVAEAAGFDACLGHPTGMRVYHHHQNPRCLHSAADTTVHSPLLGYAFDGYPVYGPYGHANPDGTGGVRRIRPSYRLRDITVRTTLPDGTVLDPADWGPPVSPAYPLGYYVEDHEFVAAGLGDLDAHNGRVTVTPEYPGGTYAYFVTIHAGGSSAYPYIIGPRYYGELVQGNTGPGGGHVTIGEPVTEYFPPTLGVTPGGGGAPPAGPRVLALGPANPNPASTGTSFRLWLAAASRVSTRLTDVTGRQVRAGTGVYLEAGTHVLPLDLAGLPPGIYFVEARANGAAAGSRVSVVR